MNLDRDSTSMRRRVGKRWLTHEVLRPVPAAESLFYEHIVPILVFALRERIYGESFGPDDVQGCLVTASEHSGLPKLRATPEVFLPALLCERAELLDVCLRRYRLAQPKLTVRPLPEPVVAPRRAAIDATDDLS
jgi:hypothetical protein